MLSQGRDEYDIPSDELISQTCGANYCPAQLVTTEEEIIPKNISEEIGDNFGISDQKRYTLAGIYLACSVGAALILAVLLDPLTR